MGINFHEVVLHIKKLGDIRKFQFPYLDKIDLEIYPRDALISTLLLWYYFY